MKRVRKFFALGMTIAMVSCYIPNTAYAEVEAPSPVNKATAFVDLPNDWSTSALKNAAANGLLKGYQEGGKTYIKPASHLTRAEIAAIVNRAFGAEEAAALTGVTDVSADAWYADVIGKAVQMETMALAEKMRPDDKITRQEAFSILARAFKAEPADESHQALNAFGDKAQIAPWAEESICALVEKGVLSGSNGNLNPTANITRAEFAKIMDNMVKQYIGTAGTVTQVPATGSVMIYAAGVTLSNATINGDLIIGDGVGDGEITLDSVKVTGKTIVRGGGIHSVILKGSSLLGTVVVAKVDGDVRLAVESGAEVKFVFIEAGKKDVIIEGAVENLEVGSSAPVIVQNATIGTLRVTAPEANLTIAKSGTVSTMNVGADAKATSIAVAGTITTLVNAAQKANVTVTGTVQTMEVHEGAKGTTLEISKEATIGKLNTAVDMTTGGEGKATSVVGVGTVTTSGGTVVEKPKTETKPSSGGSSSGSSSSGGETKNFAGGAGTVSDPYQIATAQQLGRIQKFLNSHFVLTADINLSAYGNWTPIGEYRPKDAAAYDYSADTAYAFTGSFDGNNHTISNLSISRNNLAPKDMTGTGLFGGIAGNASIQNLNLHNVTINSSGSCTGAVLGMGMSNNENAIKNNKLTGTNVIKSYGSVAGLVGSAQDSNIIACSAVADVTMTGASNGAGIIGGGIEGGKIIGCDAAGTITAMETVEMDGKVVGSLGVGGLAGCAFESEEVSDNIARDIEITVGVNAIMVGGLLGYSGVVNEGPLTSDPQGVTLIKNCKTVNVDISAEAGATRIGGIVGSGFCGENYASYYPSSSAMQIVSCEANGQISADGDAIVGSILGYAFRNCAVVSSDGAGLTGAEYQVGGADASQAVALENADSALLENAAVAQGEFDAPSSDGLEELVVAEEFAEGSGTEDDPWQISNAEELALMGEYLEDHFILTQNIDLEGKLWNPIGLYEPNDYANGDTSAKQDLAFIGTFDGNNKVISNLTIIRDDLNARDMTGTGLFGGIAGEAAIHDLTIENATVYSTGAGTAALVGMAMSSNENAIKNITLSGENCILGSNSVGGVIGNSQDTNIKNCSVDAEVIMTAAGHGAGVLGGGVEGGVISGCRVTGSVTATAVSEAQISDAEVRNLGSAAIGGMLGCAFESTEVSDCSAEDIVITVGENARMIGGLLGYSGIVNEGLFKNDPQGLSLIKNCKVEGLEIVAGAGSTRIGGVVGSGFCGLRYTEYYPASSAMKIVGCSAEGSISAKSEDAIVGSILGYAFRNSIVVSSDGLSLSGASNQVGGADAAKVVPLANIK